jgi:hypothetical protein
LADRFNGDTNAPGIAASLDAAPQVARLRGARFLTAKTLSPSKLDPNYAATRRLLATVDGAAVSVKHTTPISGSSARCFLLSS